MKTKDTSKKILSIDDPTKSVYSPVYIYIQTKLFVMVEENAGTGARLDGELQRGRGENVILRGESRDVVPSTSSSSAAALNNNGATSNSNLASGGIINSNNNGSSPASSGIGNPNLCQEGNESQTHTQEDGKRLSANSSPVEKRSSASDKSVSPIDKKNSPIDRKDRSSPIDRKSSPVGSYKTILYYYYL